MKKARNSKVKLTEEQREELLQKVNLHLFFIL